MVENNRKLEQAFIPVPLPVTHSWQRGEQFRHLVEMGFSQTLENSGFCWLSCLDMATSTFTADKEKRINLITDIAINARAAGMVLPDGSAAFEDREEEHITIINEQLRAHHIPLSVEAITVQSPEDIVSQLEMGNMLILTADIDGGHAILMDKVFTDNYGSESIMSYWDPAVPIAELSQQFMPTTRTFFLLYNGVEHFPVTVGSNIKVIRRISDDTSQN